MKNKNIILIITGSVLIGLLLGYWFFKPEENIIATEESHVHETFTCSMHPQIRRNEPGKCPICGMDLIPVSDMDSEMGTGTVTLTKTAAALANVQTTVVGRSVAEKVISLNGTIATDETAIRSQTAHVNGRIEALYINSTGENVSVGQPLALVYAPDLILAQKELIQVAARKDLNPGLYNAAVSKLKSFELTNNQIRQIEETGKVRDNVTIHADYNGIVTEKKVNLGDHVKAGDVLFTLSDLSGLWVNFEVYEDDAPFVNLGDSVEFTVASMPGEKFYGKITFINPVVNPNSRITIARVEIRNRNGSLKPDMYVRGRVVSRSKEGSGELVLPKSAVLWTGERSLVYVETPGSAHSYRLRQVELGMDLGESYVIKSGLQPGEKVVTNGTFSVDAAAQLSGKESMMNQPERFTEDLPGEAILEKFRPVLKSYMGIKNSLVSSEFASAKSNSEEMKTLLLQLDPGNDEVWKKSIEHMKGALGNMSESKNIDEMRRHFIALSEEVVRWSRGIGDNSSPLFIMYCPMANDNNGALWVSNSEAVENPYYGDMMLNCGEITETIN